jgi:Popeye protein conserved region
MGNPTVWINVANVLYLASYSVRDILWLRILTVVASLLLIPYYAMQPVPLAPAIAWNVVFIAINTYWIIKLLIERRPVHFTADEARLRELSFPSLTPQEARNLFAMGDWDDVAPGASLVEHDNGKSKFSVILRGDCDFVYRTTKVAELGEGQFVGPIDRSAQNAPGVDVIVRKNARIMCWPQDRLSAFLKNRPDIDLALERSVGLEVQRILDTALTELHET